MTTDDSSHNPNLVYGLDISQFDPHSAEYRQASDLICLCRMYDRFNPWMLPMDHNAQLRAIERQCELVGVSFAELSLTLKDDSNWRDRLACQRQYRPPQREPRACEMDEPMARRIAGQKLIGTGCVLRRGVVFHDGDVWRFPTRLPDEADVPFDGQSMVVTVRVGPEDMPN